MPDRQAYEMARWLREPADVPRKMGDGILLDCTGRQVALLGRGPYEFMGTNTRMMESAAWRVIERFEAGLPVDEAIRQLERAMPAFVNMEYNHCDVCSGTYHAIHEGCLYCERQGQEAPMKPSRDRDHVHPLALAVLDTMKGAYEHDKHIDAGSEWITGDRPLLTPRASAVLAAVEGAMVACCTNCNQRDDCDAGQIMCCRSTPFIKGNSLVNIRRAWRESDG